MLMYLDTVALYKSSIDVLAKLKMKEQLFNNICANYYK